MLGLPDPDLRRRGRLSDRGPHRGGGTVGFIHRRCGPPQIIDRRRNRPAAIAQHHYLAECVTDAQAFAATRNYPSPHVMLVVSPSSPMAVTTDNGEAIKPWLDVALEAGFVPVAPAVVDAAPEVLRGWSLRIDGDDTVVCDSPKGPVVLLRTRRSW